jgi:hypothetical protein
MLNSQKNDARDIFPPPRWVSRKRNYGRPFLQSLYHITSYLSCQENFSLMKIHLLLPNNHSLGSLRIAGYSFKGINPSGIGPAQPIPGNKKQTTRNPHRFQAPR